MAAALLTRGAMQFHLLVIGIAICLSFFVTTVVHSQEEYYRRCKTYPLDDVEDDIVTEHNRLRSKVYPYASNMQRMFWSNKLAKIAEKEACECAYDHNSGIHKVLKKTSTIVSNQGLGTDDQEVLDIVKYWFKEGEGFNYEQRACFPDNDKLFTCRHYIRSAWSKGCEIGCAIAECSGLDDDLNSYYKRYYGLDEDYDGAVMNMVCVYGGGYPENEDDLFYSVRPYMQGPPCDDCPRLYPLCDPHPLFNPEATNTIGGLCYNSREMCVGSDPHFAIRLPEGNLLCYTFQGMYGSIFNLVGNDQLQINALFIPDNTAYNNTWLGSIGISILDHGKKITTIQFTAADQRVKIGGEGIQLDPRTVKKLSFNKGKLTVLEIPSNHSPRYPRIQVEVIDLELDFTVRFSKNNHLDLYWHSIGIPLEDSKGVVGQFFHRGVKIDAGSQLLRMPGRLPVPVEEKDLWKFMERSLHGDTKCWTTAYHSSQGAGIVAGTYKDYIVDDLLAL